MTAAWLNLKFATVERRRKAMRRSWFELVAAVLVTIMAWPALAQQGPVAAACTEDMQKFCADKQHGQGQVRACLEANKDKVSVDCKTALDTTGPGKGKKPAQ
jgi:Cysteine rich repeat